MKDECIHELLRKIEDLDKKVTQINKSKDEDILSTDSTDITT